MCFFFSSRRRHTRWNCDWSSDVCSSDLLVHVVDSSAPDPGAQIAAVRTVLAEIAADRVPELLAFNKADIAPDAKRLVDRHPGAVMISATTGEGIDLLLRTI